MSVSNTYSTEELWQLIENKTNSLVPKYVQNLLKSKGFDNIIAITNMDMDDIEYLESYARSEEYLKKIPECADLTDFLGTYHDDQNNFEILRGHKKQLLQIIQRFSKEYADGTFSSFVRKSTQQVMKLNSGIKGKMDSLIMIQINLIIFS